MPNKQKNKTVGLENLPTLEKKFHEIKSQLSAAEKKYKEAKLCIGEKDHIGFRNRETANYIISGHATELIEKIRVISKLSGQCSKMIYGFPEAEIHGIVNKSTVYKRYGTILIKHNDDVWVCQDIKDAYDKIEKIKPLIDYEWLVDKLSSKFYDLKFKIEKLKNKNKVKPLAKKTSLRKAA